MGVTCPRHTRLIRSRFVGDFTTIVDLVKKDPLRAYVGIPIAAAADPNPHRVVKFTTSKGKQVKELRMPAWDGTAWAWWGEIAMRMAQKAIPRNDEGVKDVQSQMDHFVEPLAAMRAIGAAKPTDAVLAKFYDRAVRLVIAVKAAVGAGEKWSEIAVASFVGEMPANVKESIAWVAGAGEKAVRKIAQAAGGILGALFEGLFSGIGPIGMVLIAGAAYLWWKSRRSGREEESD